MSAASASLGPWRRSPTATGPRRRRSPSPGSSPGPASPRRSPARRAKDSSTTWSRGPGSNWTPSRSRSWTTPAPGLDTRNPSMKRFSEIPISVLDLAPIREGGTPAQAFREAMDLARHVEEWGYRRYWVAEHHNIPGIASAATAVVIGHVAGGTSRIRVGAGGIMLPNHSPLVIAEQFGTLASLYPGRIDLGLGRAPGGDQRTAQALRRKLGSSGDTFPQDLLELQSYFRPASPGRPVRAVPGEGLDVPIWLLGSSDFSARLAAGLGLPFAFASHFAPDYLYAALDLYRTNFEPSESLSEPYAMVGVNVIAADT